MSKSFLAAASARHATCVAAACTQTPSLDADSPMPLTLDALDADLLVPIVVFVDTRWHHITQWAKLPLEPLAVCALGCVSRGLTAKIKSVRPAIRTGTFGQAQSGALHRRTNPGPIQSVADALAFEAHGIWQIGQLSSLSYSDVESIVQLSTCRALHTLQLTHCRMLQSLDGLGGCPSLQQLFVVNCDALSDVEGLAGSLSLRELELSGCRRLTDVSALGSCPALENLCLSGCTAVSDVSCLSACAQLHMLELIGCKAVTDIRELRNCSRLWKLDIRGTGYLVMDGAISSLPVPRLPSVTELRGPGWQDLGRRGRVL